MVVNSAKAAALTIIWGLTILTATRADDGHWCETPESVVEYKEAKCSDIWKMILCGFEFKGFIDYVDDVMSQPDVMCMFERANQTVVTECCYGWEGDGCNTRQCPNGEIVMDKNHFTIDADASSPQVYPGVFSNPEYPTVKVVIKINTKHVTSAMVSAIYFEVDRVEFKEAVVTTDVGTFNIQPSPNPPAGEEIFDIEENDSVQKIVFEFTNTDATFPYEGTVTFESAEGSGCNTASCEPPCMNGGTCVFSSDDQPICSCPAPFTGSTCTSHMIFRRDNSEPHFEEDALDSLQPFCKKE